jgi:hypothetical protein
MRHARADRRLTERHRHVDAHGIVLMRLKPGRFARLIDVSAGGALIETSHRLLPGTSVELFMESIARRTAVRGRVLRCAVVRVRPTFICYRGAIGFDRQLPWFTEAAGHHVPSVDARSAEPFRADITPQVI